MRVSELAGYSSWTQEQTGCRGLPFEERARSETAAKASRAIDQTAVKSSWAYVPKAQVVDL